MGIRLRMGVVLVGLLALGGWRCSKPRVCTSSDDCGGQGACQAGVCVQAGLFAGTSEFKIEVLGTPNYGPKSAEFVPAEFAWKRDETITLRLTWDSPAIALKQVSLDAQLGGAGVALERKKACDGVAQCAEFLVTLSQIPMPSFEAQLKVVVSVARFAESVGAEPRSVSGVSKVTRWNWARKFGERFSPSGSTPAIGARSVWYLTTPGRSDQDAGVRLPTSLGVVAIDSAGTLEKRFAAQGVFQASYPRGSAVITQVATQEYVVFQRTRADPFQFSMVPTAGGPDVGFRCRGISTSSVLSQLGMPAPSEVVAIAREGFPIRVNLTETSDGGCTRVFEPDAGPSETNQVYIPGTPITNGRIVYWPEPNVKGAVRAMNFAPPQILPLASDEPVSDDSWSGSAGGTMAAYPDAKKIVVLKYPPDAGGEIAAFDQTGFLWQTTSLRATVVGSPLVSSRNEIVGTVDKSPFDAELYDCDAFRLNEQGGNLVRSAKIVDCLRSPVLGADRRLYFLNRNGDIVEHLSDQFAANEKPERWVTNLPQGVATDGGTTSQITITCNTTHPESKTGILGFATSEGWLVTYIVDAPGLDPDAPWPKALHDNRNTGNVNTPIERCPTSK